MIESHLSDKPKTIKELSETLNWEDPGCISRANVNRFILSYIIPTGNGASCAGLYPHQYVRAYPKTTTAEDCIKDFAPEVIIDTTCKTVDNDKTDTVALDTTEVNHRIVDNEPVVESNDKLSTLTYGGISIGIKGQMVDATAMWRACGSPKNLKPNDWLRREDVKAYIAKCAEDLTSGENRGAEFQLVRVFNGGLNPHTEMHRLVAVELARSMDPGLAVQINKFYLEGYDNGVAHPKQQAITTTEQRLLLMLEKQAERAEEKDRLDRERQDIYLAESRANREMLGVMLATLNSLKQEQPIAQQCSPIPSQGTSDIEMGKPYAKVWFFVAKISIQGHRGRWGWAIFGTSPFLQEDAEVLVSGIVDTDKDAHKTVRGVISKDLHPHSQYVINDRINISNSEDTVRRYAEKIWGKDCLFNRLRAV